MTQPLLLKIIIFIFHLVVESIDKERTPLTHLEAIYIVQPTEKVRGREREGEEGIVLTVGLGEGRGKEKWREGEGEMEGGGVNLLTCIAFSLFFLLEC